MRMKLVVDYKIPSLNTLFAQTQWDRHQEKKVVLKAVLHALSASRALEPGCLTPTTLPEGVNSSLMPSATRKQSRMTIRKASPSTSVNVRSITDTKNTP